MDPKNYYGAASDYSAGYAAYGTLHYTHRFKDGGQWHTVLRSGGYDRDQRASTIRFCVRTTNAQTGVVSNPDCPTVAPSQETVDDSTPLNRGTNNKVQDLHATYLQTDYTNAFTWFGRKNEVLAGIDLAREEFNNYSMVLPAGVVLNKNDPRTTVGTPNDGTSVDEGLRQKVQTRNFVAKALGVYAQDLIEVVKDWKVLAGLRWDRFEGDYVSPPAGANPQIERARSDSLWSQRFGVLWQPSPTASYYVSYGTSFNTSGELYNYDAQGSNTPPEKSRNIEVGAKFDLFEGRLSARTADLPFDQVQRAQPRLARRPADRGLRPVGQAPRRRGRDRPGRPHHARLGGVRLLRMDSQGRDRRGRAGRQPDRRARGPAAVADAAAQRHDLDHLPADAGDPDRRRPERAQRADAEPQPGRHRRAELRDRRPDGRVRLQQGDRVQGQRHQRHQQAVRGFALHRPLHPGPAAHLLRDDDGALLSGRRAILRPMLLHVRQVLTPEELGAIRKTLAAVPWGDGRVTAGAQSAQAKNNEQLAQGRPELPGLQQIVLAALNRHAMFFSAALPRRVLPPMFNRYGGSANAFGNHVDNAIRFVPGRPGERVRTDISCTLFLAEPEEYDGGELVIEDTYGAQRVKLPAGDMVLYPGTSVHRVEPVTLRCPHRQLLLGREHGAQRRAAHACCTRWTGT